MPMTTITHPERRCGDGCDSPLYHAPFDDGENLQLVHACEHMIRLWWFPAPDADEPFTQDEATVLGAYDRAIHPQCNLHGEPRPPTPEEAALIERAEAAYSRYFRSPES